MGKLRYYLFIIYFLAVYPLLSESCFRLEVSLKGRWHFKIGDNTAYADPDLSEKSWEYIHVPGNWEGQRYPGYDGHAWYRKTVKIDKSLSKRDLYLILGRIDDVDQVFINGRLIGGYGGLPPEYQTAWSEKRIYSIPSQYIRFGKRNHIAVHVFDDHGAGGIVDGPVGLYSKPLLIHVLQSMSGYWKFAPGDHAKAANYDFDDSEWTDLLVPAFWDSHGFADLDGHAWYRLKFTLESKLSREQLILVLGKIDDVDEIFLNGTRIGRTGFFPELKRKDSGRANTYRFYTLPSYLLFSDKKNVISVHVYDYEGRGGIYKGPVGLITRETYLKSQKRIQRFKDCD